ncbi:MAG: hypothetical protein WHT65_02750 [Pseudothermotoga sp.]
MKKKFILIITVIVLSYCVTSIGFWLVENYYGIGGRFFHYHAHKLCLEGKGPAPNQYRYPVYPMVEYFFKHLGLRWYSSVFLTTKRWVGLQNEPTAELDNQMNLDAYISETEREKLAEDLEQFLKEKTIETTKNPIISNLLVSTLNSFGWKNWVKNPFDFAKQLLEIIPEDFKQVFDDKSDLSRVIYGYATMRFFFTVLILLFLYQWCKLFVDELISYLGIFVLAVFMAFSYGDFLQQEFIISLFIFVLSLTLIYKSKPWWVILVVILMHSFVRSDHALFVAAIYTFYNFSWHRKSFLKNTVLILLPILITIFLSKVAFPQAKYYTPLIRIKDNFTDPWALVYPVVTFVLPFLFLKRINKVEFFYRTWLWIIPFVVLNATVALTREIRLFLPMLVYLLPLFLMGIKTVYNNYDK